MSRTLVMGYESTFIRLDELDSSALVLITLAALGVLAAFLFWTGAVGWALHITGAAVRRSVQTGFELWKRLFAWADWLRFFAFVLGLLTLGWLGGTALPWLWVICGSALLFIGVTACLAYMSIDLERYEHVTLGYAALGTFFSAVAARTTAGELLLPILLFPLSVPLVLAGAEGGQALVAGGRAADYWDWLSLAVAFDVIFGTVCTLAFEYVIEE